MAQYIVSKRPSSSDYDTANGKWNDMPNAYDSDESTYAYSASKTSVSYASMYLNWDSWNLPSDTIINKVKLASKLSNTVSGGTCACGFRLYKRTFGAKKTTGTEATWVTREYTAEEFWNAILALDGTSAEDLTVLNNGNIVDYFNKTLTLLWHSGNSDGDTLEKYNQGCQARVYTRGSSLIKSSVGRCYESYIELDYTIPDYTLTLTATEGGTVTGGGTYESGTTATLTATPSDGYKFVQWSDGDTNATRTVTVAADATYTAEFEKTGVNKIYVGTQNPTVYVGTTKVKAVYVGTTKIYG